VQTLQNLWDKATKDVGDVKGTLNAAKTGATAVRTEINKLRKTALLAADATKFAAKDAADKRDIVHNKTTGKQKAVDDAEEELQKALLACKNSKWDTYNSRLSESNATRQENIKKIRTLLKDNAKKAPKIVDGAGAKGARCEKALTAGSAGPRRGPGTCTNAETDCCGAAKNLDKETGLLTTIEVCWPKAEKAYTYQPPRKPMETTMPAAVTTGWEFACIEGAQKLVAASAALATAAYMMA